MTPLIQLRTFLEVYRARSISRAAVTLAITQPAASAHIRTLEGQLGRALFRRHARGVEATPAADELAAAVAPGLEGLEVTFGSMRAGAEGVAGPIRVAGPAEFMRARMIEPLARLRTAGLTIRITLGGRDAIYGALRSGAVDLAVTASRPEDLELGAARIAEETFVPVASPATATPDGSRLLDVLACPLIAYDEDLPLVAPVLEAIGVGRERVRPTIVVPNLRMIRDLVEADCGWSVLPDYLIEDGLARGRLRRLDTNGRSVMNTLYLAWPRAALRHPRIAYAREGLLASLA